MQLTVNEVTTVVAESATVADLVAALDTEPRGVAVAVNEEVVPRSRWADRALATGDRVEILGIAQGG